MGSITRSFANNITTSGVFTASAFNNASFNNVTSLPGGAVSVDDMVLVSSATASTSANLNFTLASYKEYVFHFINMHPATNGTPFEFQASTNAGSSYGVTATSTFFRARHDEADTTAQLGYDSGEDLTQSTDYQTLAYDTENDNDQCCSGYLRIIDPSNTTFVKHWISRFSNYGSGNYIREENTAGYFNTTSAINSVRFQFASGNIDSGEILMYGIN